MADFSTSVSSASVVSTHECVVFLSSKVLLVCGRSMSQVGNLEVVLPWEVDVLFSFSIVLVMALMSVKGAVLWLHLSDPLLPPVPLYIFTHTHPQTCTQAPCRTNHQPSTWSDMLC